MQDRPILQVFLDDRESIAVSILIHTRKMNKVVAMFDIVASNTISIGANIFSMYNLLHPRTEGPRISPAWKRNPCVKVVFHSISLFL